MALLAASWSAQVHAAGGSIAIGIDDPPRSSDPRAEHYIVDVVAPGEGFTRQVRITNATTEPRQLLVYATSAAVEDGAFTVDGHETSDLTDWIAIEPETLRLAAGEVRSASVVVAVPDDALPGERYGVIWAQPQPVEGDGNVVNRVGVRVYLLVDEDGHGASDIVVDSLTPRRSPDGGAEVVAALHNVGDRAVDLSGSIALVDHEHDRTAAGSISGAVTLAPGQRTQVVATLDGDVARGPWDALLTFAANGDSWRARGEVTFPAADGEVGETVLATMVIDPERPSALLIGAAVAAALAVLVAAARLRRATR